MPRWRDTTAFLERTGVVTTMETNQVTSLFLSTTQQCNISCSYCSADAGPHRRARLGVDVATATVETWLKGLVHEEAMIVFTGGEPTLWGYRNLDLVCERARSLAACLGKSLQIGIQTNGTRIGTRFIEWCHRWDVRPSISIDGPPATSDATRGLGAKTVDGIRRAPGRAHRLRRHPLPVPYRVREPGHDPRLADAAWNTKGSDQRNRSAACRAYPRVPDRRRVLRIQEKDLHAHVPSQRHRASRAQHGTHAQLRRSLLAHRRSLQVALRQPALRRGQAYGFGQSRRNVDALRRTKHDGRNAPHDILGIGRRARRVLVQPGGMDDVRILRRTGNLRPRLRRVPPHVPRVVCGAVQGEQAVLEVPRQLSNRERFRLDTAVKCRPVAAIRIWQLWASGSAVGLRSPSRHGRDSKTRM